jgi:hypothetical protein
MRCVKIVGDGNLKIQMVMRVKKYHNPYKNRPSDILDTIREILLQRNKMKYEEKIWLK